MRLGALVMIVVVMISMTACSLFTDDLDQKFSTKINVASTENSSIAVTRKELYQAYLSWGYQYASQMSQTELLTYITETLINNKILEQISVEKFGELRDAEKAIAHKYAFEALDQVLRRYVYEILDLKDPEDATTEEDSTVKYTPYSKTIIVEGEGQNRTFSLYLDGYQELEDQANLAEYTVYCPNLPGVATDRVARQAVSKVVRSLKNLENGFTKLTEPQNYLDLDNPYLQGLSKDERAVLNREIVRMIESNQTSLLTARLNTAYNLGFVNLTGETAQTAWDQYLDRNENFKAWQESIEYGQSVASNTAYAVEKFYLEKVRNAIKSYAHPDDGADLESAIMQGSLSDIYYIPDQVAQNLFTVSHILVGFTDEQKAQYTSIMKRADEDSSYNVQDALDELYRATQSNGKSVYEIYNEVKAAVQSADSLTDKCIKFRDLIYQYNTDPGMQNPEYEYLMSVNKDKNSMIEPFTDASIDLHQNHHKGDISNIVWGEYGAHIIMYTRDVADFIYTGDAAMLDLEYEKTLYATQTAYGNKTRFDALVGNFSRNYSSYQTHLLNDFKSTHAVTIYDNELKNFF